MALTDRNRNWSRSERGVIGGGPGFELGQESGVGQDVVPQEGRMSGATARDGLTAMDSAAMDSAAMDSAAMGLAATDFRGNRSRRQFLRRAVHGGCWGAVALAGGLGGCVLGPAALGGRQPDAVWGRRGLSDGRLLKPRAIAVDAEDELYLVDTTGRIQVFDGDGELQRLWKMPETEFGRPTGLAVDAQQRVLVADTHYFRMMVFSRDGESLEAETIGGESGTEPGQFAFVTDVVRDREGVTYIGEYGDLDRIQRYDPEGRLVDWWGSTGRESGQFVRPQSLILSPDEQQLWIADACNHRVQVYDVTRSPAELVAIWGEEGSEPGKLSYPYGISFAADGTLYVCEYGNQRVQQFTTDGKSLGVLGRPGHEVGEFYQPWGLTFDSRGRLFVLDSNNHRVQRYDLG